MLHILSEGPLVAHEHNLGSSTGLRSASSGVGDRLEELRRANAELTLRVAELNHRVRNILQVVMGLASQTLHRSEDLWQFEAAFFGRMQALARAYDLLSREDAYKVAVGDLIRLQLSAFATEGGRYTATGEPLILKPNAAPSLGLVLYELATNSTKYGALSVPTGHVHVQWRREVRADGKEQFMLEWKESGGPAVRPPTRHGFGSELVQRQLKYELEGSASMEFHQSGIVVTLAIPVEEAVESGASAGEVK
jgi:two-component system CheB/CheR fusion protein